MTQVEPDDNRPPPHHSDIQPAHLTSDSARQGPKGKRVLYVLIGTVIGSIIVIGSVFIWFALYS